MDQRPGLRTSYPHVAKLSALMYGVNHRSLRALTDFERIAGLMLSDLEAKEAMEGSNRLRLIG